MTVRRSVFARLFRPRVSAFGLEITTASMKLVELRGNGPYTVTAASIRDVPAGAVSQGELLNVDLLAEMLREEHRVARVRSRHVVGAIANNNVITRNITMPKLPPQELGEAIKWEAERYIPFPMSDVSFDYHVLPQLPGESGDEITVTVVAARLEHVTRLAELIKRAGLEPMAIETKSFALLRALAPEFNRQGADTVTLLLEIGAAITTLTAVRNNNILLNRNVGVSGDQFTEALMRYFDLDYSEAEDLKMRHGNVTRPEMGAAIEFNDRHLSKAQVYEALRPALYDLTAEIRRSIDFIRAQLNNVSINEMLITGGGSQLAGLEQALSNVLEIPVRTPNPFAQLNGTHQQFSNVRSPGLFAVPIGLAMRGVADLD